MRFFFILQAKVTLVFNSSATAFVVQRPESLTANPWAMVQSRQPEHSSPSCSSFPWVGQQICASAHLGKANLC